MFWHHDTHYFPKQKCSQDRTQSGKRKVWFVRPTCGTDFGTSNSIWGIEIFLGDQPRHFFLLHILEKITPFWVDQVLERIRRLSETTTVSVANSWDFGDVWSSVHSSGMTIHRFFSCALTSVNRVTKQKKRWRIATVFKDFWYRSLVPCYQFSTFHFFIPIFHAGNRAFLCHYWLVASHTFRDYLQSWKMCCGIPCSRWRNRVRPRVAPARTNQPISLFLKLCQFTFRTTCWG